MQKSLVLVLALIWINGLKAQNGGRTVLPFTGGWSFVKGAFADQEEAARAPGWTAVSIPHTWNNVDMQHGLPYYQGDGWYKKSFSVDTGMKRGRVFLRFEGVGQVADVYINQKWVGQHKGAYSAFCMEITHFIRSDTMNTIMVKANNAERKDVIPINNVLFGVYGGMYRPVSLILTGRINISTTDYASPGIYIRQDSVSDQLARIRVTSKIENTEDQPSARWVQAVIRDSSGAVVTMTRKRVELLPQGMNNVVQELTVRQPRLWNAKKDPYLYRVTVSVCNGDSLEDSVTQPLGLRTFSIVPGKGFYLNGQPYRLYGVCRHQEWQGDGSALRNDQHRTDLDLIAEIGATSIRFAHYQQAEVVYSDCDTMGFVIWAEVPFVNRWSGQEADNAKQQLTELIRQNYNHPSIYVWGLHNEVYSATADSYVPVLTQQMNDLAKTEDPDRFTVSTSGYGKMDMPANRKADIQAMNRYYGWYEGKISDLEPWIEGLEKAYPDGKVVLAEYGCEANTDQQSEEVADKGDPAGAFWPEGFQTHFHEVQWGIISKHPYLVASYVWNMFDFCVPGAHGGGVLARNLKGLVSYDRKIRKDAFYWYKANWSPGPVLYLSGRRDSIRTGEFTTVKVFAHMDTVVLYINGRKSAGYQLGTTTADFVFSPIRLRRGRNKIEAVGRFQGKTYRDEMDWIRK